MQPLGGLGEGVFLGHGDEAAQGPAFEVHRSSSSHRKLYASRGIIGDLYKSRKSSNWTRRAVRRRISQLICVERTRSEEHTSELQSLMRISYAVFCLKKKQMTH